MLRCCRLGCACLALIAAGHPVQAAQEPAAPARVDHLDLASGAIVRAYSSQAQTETYSAMTAIDGSANTGWSTEQGAAFPHRLEIELAGPVRIERFAIDNSAADEDGWAGISAREISLEASTDGPGGPWTEVLRGEVGQGVRTELEAPEPFAAQWLRLTIHSNWGDPDYTEVMELSAWGERLREVTPVALDGVFDTNYRLVEFASVGMGVVGCYDWGDGTLMGSRDSRVVQFEWREDGGVQVGTAIMALSESGDFINGLWYEAGVLRGFWFGERVTDGREPECEIRARDALGMALDENGRAVLYGIYFDFGSDVLRPDSREPLEALLAVLSERDSIRMLIEGHTDSVDTDEYNLDLSRRRAAAVVAWLVERGVAADRLDSTGFGEARPVADNDTPQGRALNRRVEVVVVQ